MKGDLLYKKALIISDKMFRASTMSKKQRIELFRKYLAFIRKAAYKGQAEAQFELGLQYENVNYLGLNNPNYNPGKSKYWYAKACAQNHPQACINLSMIYTDFLRKPGDISKYFQLNSKAFDLGDANASNNIALMYLEIKDYKQAFEWFQKTDSKDEKIGETYYYLGNCYYLGQGAKKSYKIAYQNLIKAIKSDYITEYIREEALFRIGQMYFYGRYKQKSFSKAKYLIKQANKDGDHEHISIFMKKNGDKFSNIPEDKVDFD